MQKGFILVLWVALSLLSTTPVRSAIFFYPYAPLFGQPYTPDEYTLTEGQSIFSGNPADRVVIGYAPGSNQFALPYPYREPYKTVVNVSDKVTIQPHTLVYSGSTLNLLAGSTMGQSVSIYDASLLNVTDAQVQGSVAVLGNGKVNLTNAKMYGNVTGNATSTIKVTNSTVYGQMVTGNSFSTSGSTFGSLVTTGSASATMNTGQVLSGASALDTSTMSLTGIHMSSSISANNFGVMNVVGGSVGGTVHAQHFSLVTLTGGVFIFDEAYVQGGTLVLKDGTIAGLVRVEPHPTAAGGIGTFLMSGGTVGTGLDVDSGAIALVSGGTIRGPASVTGGNLTYSGADLLGNVAVSSGGTMSMSSGYVSGNISVTFGGEAHISGGVLAGYVYAHGGNVRLSGNIDVAGEVLVDSGGSFEMSDGFVGRGIDVENNSDAYITDGLVIGGLDARLSDVTIAGGTFRGDGNNLGGDVAAYGGKLDVVGGLIEGNLIAADGAVVTFSGGAVSGHGEMRGGVIFHYGGGEFLGITDEPPTEEPLRGALDTTSHLTAVAAITAYDDAVINIYGTDLVATLLNPDYEGAFSQYGISGILADGTVITGSTFLIANEGGATYHLLPPPVPEPSTFALVVLSLLGHCLRRRRRHDVSGP